MVSSFLKSLKNDPLFKDHDIPILKERGILVEKNKDENIYKVKWNSNFKSKIQVYKRQRDYDAGRVLEIYNSFVEGKYIPFIIHLAYMDKKLVCIDGNHRRCALDLFFEEHSNSNRDVTVFLFILTSENEDKIQEIYTNLNKNIPVPDMLTENTDNVDMKIQEEIKEFVRNYKKIHSDFFSKTASPRKPHTNETNFMNLISYSMKKYNNNINEIIKKLDERNLQLAEKFRNSDIAAFKKCKEANFFLFCEGSMFEI